MKKLLVIVTILFIGGGVAYTRFRPAATPPSTDSAGAAGGKSMGMPVEAEPVTTQPLSHEIIAVGSLRSDESVTISSEIAGRIARISFQEGQPVAAGALLFELDDSVYKAELDQARADLHLAKRNHERALELFSKNLLSARERDETAAKLDLDQATLKLAAARLAKTRITAPFAGVAGLRMVSPGDYVDAGQKMVGLEALDNLKVDFRLAEATLPHVAANQTLNVEVDAYPGETFSGKVYAIDPRVSDTDRSIALRARLPNPQGRLRPGLFARVRLVVWRKDNALLVPEQAVFPQSEQMFVYVIEDGKAALRPVQVGLRQSGKAEIVSGLKPGDIVITAGVQKIGPGSPVTAINMPPSQPTAEQKPKS